MALNIISKQTTIKLGPHKGEEMYVMKVDYPPRTVEIKDAPQCNTHKDYLP